MVERLRKPTIDKLLVTVYVLCAVVITWKLLFHPHSQVLAGNASDQYYFEWQLTDVQQALFHFHNPLFSHGMNAPTGFNLAANPQIILPAAVLAPITWLFGAAVSFALLMTFNFAATAALWRWFLLRNAVTSQTAAFVGGLFLGFGPSIVSHSLAHPNLAAQWLVPVIVDRVLRLREGDRTVRDGLVLGVLVAAQLFIGEEILFLTAVGLGLFVLFYAAMRPSVVRRDGLTFLKGSGVAVGVAVLLLAYPLKVQFSGPMSFHGVPFSIEWYSADLKSYWRTPNLTVTGDPAKLDPLAAGTTEQAAMIGGLLILLVAVLVLWCVRSAAVRASLAAVAVLVLLSIGPTPKFDGKPLPSPFGPDGVWQVLRTWPLLSSALPIRMALAVGCFAGILLAIGLDKVMARPEWWVRGVVLVAAVVALFPLTPRVYATNDRPAIPSFITSGAWKPFLAQGRTIVSVPLSDAAERTAMTWATAVGDGYDIPQGPVFVPGPDGRQVQFGTSNVLWTASWLIYIDKNGGGATPQITPLIQNQVAKDMKTWHAGCIVVPDTDAHVNDLRVFLDGAVGAAGEHTGGVWVWRAPGAA